MCGIAGGFWLAPPTLLNDRIKSALFAMRRRGPDHQGYDTFRLPSGTAILGHARLSIIDLSSDAIQPMHSSDGRHHLVFNGEIYNYIELKNELVAEGAIFRTNSDTEVLLSAWARWGEKALQKFKGMFSFAILDSISNNITLVRDPFGIKPLFYAFEEQSILFASDLYALRALKGEAVKLNWQRAYDYLVHGEYDFGSESFIEGAFNLMPGHLLEINLNDLRAFKSKIWWQPEIKCTNLISYREATEILREKFLDNIRLHLRSDVPIGAALSGGVDSSAIVCAMRYLEPTKCIDTFSYIAKGSEVSEERWVDLVNQKTNSNPHKVVVSEQDLAKDLEDLIATQGEPFGSTSIYAQYKVYELAHENGIKVTLDGQGADEMMGGYNGYPGQRFRSLIDQGKYIHAGYFLNEWARWPGRNRLEGLKRVVNEYSQGWLNTTLRKLNGMHNVPDWIEAAPLHEAGVITAFPEKDFLKPESGRRMMADLASSLSHHGLLGLLRHGDRNSMRFSVESRVPFLTPDLANFMLSLPEDYLVSSGGETKRLLRSAMRGIVPDEILDRRDKVGFATPEKEWLLSMSNKIRLWLSEDIGLPFLNQSVLRTHFEQIACGKRAFTWQVWRWVNFIQWYKGLQ